MVTYSQIIIKKIKSCNSFNMKIWYNKWDNSYQLGDQKTGNWCRYQRDTAPFTIEKANPNNCTRTYKQTVTNQAVTNI